MRMNVSNNLKVGSGVKTIATSKALEKQNVLKTTSSNVSTDEVDNELFFYAGLVESIEDFNRGFDGKLKFAINGIPGAPAVNFGLAEINNSNQHNIYYVLRARRKIKTDISRERELHASFSAELAKVNLTNSTPNTDDVATLLNLFGDRVVTRVTHGLDVVIVIEFFATSMKNKAEIKAALGGGIAKVIGDLDASFTAKLEQTLSNTNYKIHSHSSGMSILPLVKDGEFVQQSQGLAEIFQQISISKIEDAVVIEADWVDYKSILPQEHSALATELDKRVWQSEQLLSKIHDCEEMIFAIIEAIRPSTINFRLLSIPEHNLPNDLFLKAKIKENENWRLIIEALQDKEKLLTRVKTDFFLDPYAVAMQIQCAQKLNKITQILEVTKNAIETLLAQTQGLVELPITQRINSEIDSGNHKHAHDEFNLVASKRTNFFKVITSPAECNVKIKQHVCSSSRANINQCAKEKTYTLLASTNNNQQTLDCTSSNLQRLYLKTASTLCSKAKKPDTVTFFASIDLRNFVIPRLPTGNEIDSILERESFALT